MSRNGKHGGPSLGWLNGLIDTELNKTIPTVQVSALVTSVMDKVGTHHGFLLTDGEERIIYVSEGFLRAFFYQKNDLIESHIDDVFQFRDTEKSEMIALKQARLNHTATEFNFVQWRDIGQSVSFRAAYSPLIDEHHLFKGSVYVMMDGLLDRERNSVVEQMVSCDSMTGLKNRRQFEVDLEKKLNHSFGQSKIALIFFDMDRFKYYNATLGQFTGDTLLKEVAAKLGAIVDKQLDIYRYGGDQFAVQINGYPSMTYVHHIAEKIKNIFQKPFMLSNHELTLSASIGASLYPQTAETMSELIDQAEMAMHASKENGTSSKYHVYKETLHHHYSRQLTLEKRLNKAVEQKSFQLHYQPQYDFCGDQVVGFEALIRWFDQDLGYVPPDQFIPVAEETGLIIPIGRQVLDHACRQGKDWFDQGLNLRVGVNISPIQFQHPDFIQTVKWTLLKSGLPADRLDIEITENVLLYNRDECLNTLEQLKALGVHISIDDFGTGFSSLSYLRTFPVDMLKIDQSFVRELTNNPNDQAIVTSIIQLAHNMGMKVIAEGVETGDSLNFLIDQHCDQMQGYLYSKPIPPEDLPSFITEKRVVQRILK